MVVAYLNGVVTPVTLICTVAVMNVFAFLYNSSIHSLCHWTHMQYIEQCFPQHT